VPADLRLLECRDLRIDEAMLTGESLPASKQVAAVDAGASLGDRSCLAYSGTLVSAGNGCGVVVATGADTELGHISHLLGRVESLQTPLLADMQRFARHLTLIILVLAALTFAIGVLWRNYSTGEMLMAAVGLAVAAIPEGLPAVLTIVLALGVQRMACSALPSWRKPTSALISTTPTITRQSSHSPSRPTSAAEPSST
jgi:magnesium-transporting ATPase (P-type)